MTFKNHLLRFLSRAASPSLPSVTELIPRRILAVSTTALGDTLWTMPALNALRRCFPDAYLAALTSKIGMQIFDNNPWTDALYLLQSPLSLWHHLRGQFDTIVLFHASQRFVLPLCASLGASRLVGTSNLNKGLDDLFTTSLPPLHEHEIDRRLALVKLIGGSPTPSPLSFFLRPEEKKIFKGRWVALHPGAKDSYKCWPLQHFAAVGNALQQSLSCRILITGGATELPLMQSLSRLIPGSHLLDHTLSLREFAATLDAIDLFISSDTGPFHLACALNTPAIGIYAPTDPILCGPYLCPTAAVCSKPRSCRPCLRRKCRLPFCLLQISPNQVIQQALQLLEAHSSP